MSAGLWPVFAWAVGGLLLLACWTDVTSLRISNWNSLAIVVLFGLFAVLGRLSLEDFLWHLAAGAIVFAIGAVLFAWRKLGGGDVKLLAAVSLWIGWGALLEFILAVSLFGAVVSLAVIAMRRSVMAAVINGRGYRPVVLEPREGAPYAVAIAAGFFLRLFAAS
jgi:prepilin peptidase CpaA